MAILNKPALSLALTAATVFLLAPASRAQSDVAQGMQKALGMLEGKPLDMVASIQRQEPDAENEKSRPGRVFLMPHARGGLKPVTGELDVHVNGQGVIAASTYSALPQLKAMCDGRQKLFSQAYSNDVYDLSALLDLLRSTLDFKGLIEEVSRANRVRFTESEGAKTYRVTIMGDFFSMDDASVNDALQVKPGPIVVNLMIPKVREGVMTLAVDSSGNPTSFDFVLQVIDPMKSMMKEAMQGGGGVHAWGGAQGVSDEDSFDEEITVSYTVMSNSGPGKEFLQEAKELLDSTMK